MITALELEFWHFPVSIISINFVIFGYSFTIRMVSSVMSPLKSVCLKLSVSLILLFPGISIAETENKFYVENDNKISNEGYWGSDRGHLGEQEAVKIAPDVERAPKEDVVEDTMVLDDYEVVEPIYNNLRFAFAVEDNYEDYNTMGLDFDYVLGDAFAEDVAWQTNFRQNKHRLVWANGIGVLPDADDLELGYNAFVDWDFGSMNSRASIGTKYDDPVYAYSLSSNIYVPLTWERENGDFAPSVDVRMQGAMSNVLQFHVSAEYFSGNNIQVGNNNPISDDSHMLTVGFDYTPIPVLQLGIEANKVKKNDIGYAAYIFFNFNLWESLSEQFAPIVDLTFFESQLVPFSRSKVLARHK